MSLRPRQDRRISDISIAQWQMDNRRCHKWILMDSASSLAVLTAMTTARRAIYACGRYLCQRPQPWAGLGTRSTVNDRLERRRGRHTKTGRDERLAVISTARPLTSRRRILHNAAWLFLSKRWEVVRRASRLASWFRSRSAITK